MEEDLYAMLGVSPSANGDEIRRAYRKLAVRWHPDKNPEHTTEAEAIFKAVKLAYETLSDDGKRAQYDAGGGTGQNPFGGAGACRPCCRP